MHHIIFASLLALSLLVPTAQAHDNALTIGASGTAAGSLRSGAEPLPDPHADGVVNCLPSPTARGLARPGADPIRALAGLRLPDTLHERAGRTMPVFTHPDYRVGAASAPVPAGLRLHTSVTVDELASLNNLAGSRQSGNNGAVAL